MDRGDKSFGKRGWLEPRPVLTAVVLHLKEEHMSK